MHEKRLTVRACLAGSTHSTDAVVVMSVFEGQRKRTTGQGVSQWCEASRVRDDSSVPWSAPKKGLSPRKK